MKPADCYEIRVEGHLRSGWSGWFEGLEITNKPDGEAVLRGEVCDQAALHGILQKIRDLNLTLVSICRIDCEKQAD